MRRADPFPLAVIPLAVSMSGNASKGSPLISETELHGGTEEWQVFAHVHEQGRHR